MTYEKAWTKPLLHSRQDEGEFNEADHPRDEGGRFTAGGNTYAAKEHLKSAGFKYDPGTKTWSGNAEHKSEFERITAPTYSRAAAKAAAGVTFTKGEPKSAPEPAKAPDAAAQHWGMQVMAQSGSGVDKSTGLMIGADYAKHMPNTPEGARVIYKGGHDWEMHHAGEVRQRPGMPTLTAVIKRGMGQ
jgi:hypothetical protein